MKLLFIGLIFSTMAMAAEKKVITCSGFGYSFDNAAWSMVELSVDSTSCDTENGNLHISCSERILSTMGRALDSMGRALMNAYKYEETVEFHFRLSEVSKTPYFKGIRFNETNEVYVDTFDCTISY